MGEDTNIEENEIYPYAEAFERYYYDVGNCPFQGQDNGWLRPGETISSSNCSSGGPQYQNGIEVRNLREMRFSGQSYNYGYCSSSWSERVIATRTRGFQCANNYSQRTASGTSYCWLSPTASDPAKNAGCPGATEGNPCNPATGNKYQREADYAGTGPVPLIFERHYNSAELPAGDPIVSWGAKWRTSYDARIQVIGGTMTTAFAYRPDGRMYHFNLVNGRFASDPDLTDRLERTANGWTYAQRDGTVETYDSSGRLVAITNQVGTQTMSYDSKGRLSAVTDPFGHTLGFSYDTQNRLRTLTDPAGQAISYSYGGNNNLVKVTYADGSSKIYHYENTSLPNHLTGISYVDSTGVTTRFATYAYDSTGKAIRTEHAVTTNGSPQERFGFTYNSATQTTVTDPVGTQEIMTFAVNLGVKNLVSKLNQGDGKSLTQVFDARNNLTCKKDEEGRVTTYTYSSTNQRLTQTEGQTEGQTGDCANPTATPETRTTTYQYLSLTLALPTVISSPSVAGGQTKKKTEITYSNSLPTTITQWGYTPSGNSVSRTIRLQYNSHGQVTSIDGPRTDVSDVTGITYNECTSGGGCGQPQTVTNAIGHTTTFDAYDAHGRLLETTDPNGLKTSYAYDLRSRALSVTQTPAGGSPRVTQYSYDQRGNVTQTTQPDGLVLTYTYDAANYLTSVTDNLGDKVEYAYDLKGNRTQTLTKDPDGSLVRSIQTAYDLRNRIAQINNAGSVTSQVFDAVGNLTNTQDPNGNPTAHQYDAMNRLLQTVDALSGNTHYAYDPNDRLKQVTAPNGAATSYESDDLGNVLKEQSPDRGALTYTHDAAGNVGTITDARNVTVAYTYDALNRVTRMDYPGTEEDVALTYDNYTGCANGSGRLCKVQDQSGTTDYAYDGFGNVSQVARTELGVSYITRYSYDNADRVASITYPDGRVVNFTRDAVGRITQASAVKDGATTALASNVTYRADGQIKGLTYGNGLTETRGYDQRGRLATQTIGGETRSYTYDPNGNPTETAHAAGPTLYAYDPLDRLTQETSAAVGQLGYGYDPNGNRQSDSLGSYDYISASNRLTATPSGSITLDPAGNTTADGQGRTYTYNAAGRLTQATINGAPAASHTYNSLGQRSRKTTARGTTIYHHDLAGNLILETDTQGAVLTAYVWLNDQPLAAWITPRQSDPRPLPGDHGKGRAEGRAAVQAHRPAMPETAQRPGATTTTAAGAPILVYLHPDHLNTPRSATDANQQVIWRWEADAFGAAPAEEDPDQDGLFMPVNLRYAGQYYDSETGLHYNWNRYYDPRIGRYITSDPIGLEGGLNTYLYAEANPVRFVDPLGLFSSLELCKNPKNFEACAAAGMLPKNPARPVPIPIPVPDTQSEQCEDDKPCPPCKTISGKIVPVGTIAYRPLDTPSPGTVQHGITGPHYNIYKANQAPKNSPQPCKCFWQPVGAVPPSGLPSGAIPIEPFAN